VGTEEHLKILKSCKTKVITNDRHEATFQGIHIRFLRKRIFQPILTSREGQKLKNNVQQTVEGRMTEIGFRLKSLFHQ
jgi:hypothetical protein